MVVFVLLFTDITDFYCLFYEPKIRRDKVKDRRSIRVYAFCKIISVDMYSDLRVHQILPRLYRYERSLCNTENCCTEQHQIIFGAFI